MGVANHPNSVKLIVAVDAELVIEADQHRFASGLHRENFVRLQRLLVGLEMIKRKK